jgi:hypothetical protein
MSASTLTIKLQKMFRPARNSVFSGGLFLQYAKLCQSLQSGGKITHPEKASEYNIPA